MKSKIRNGVILLAVAVVAFVAGRTRSLPVPPNLPLPFDPVAIGLEGRRADVQFDDVPLGEAIDRLGQMYKVKLVADWNRLKDEGADETTPLTVSVIAGELHDVLAAVERKHSNYAYAVRGDTIVFTNSEDAGGTTVTRMYDIRPIFLTIFGVDYAAAIPDTPSSDFGRGQLFAPTTHLPSRDKFVEFVCSLIQERIDIASWKENGGQIGSLWVLDGYMVVSQRPYAQVQIVSLLNWLATKKEGDAVSPTARPIIELVP